MPVKGKIQTSFACSPELLAKLDSQAEGQGVSRSQLIERYLTQSVEQEKQVLGILADPTVGPQLTRLFTDPEVLRSMVKALGGQNLTDAQLRLFGETMNAAPIVAREVVKAPKKKPKGRGKR